MNKIIGDWNYRYVQGYDNKRIVAYSPVQAVESTLHKSGKSYNLRVAQIAKSYYKGLNSFDLSENPIDVYEAIMRNESQFSLNLQTKINMLLEQYEEIDERVILATWVSSKNGYTFESTRTSVRSVDKEVNDYLMNKSFIKGHIRNDRYSSPQYQGHIQRTHPLYGSFYNVGVHVSSYQEDKDLTNQDVKLKEPYLHIEDKLIVSDLANKEFDYALEELAL